MYHAESVSEESYYVKRSQAEVLRICASRKPSYLITLPRIAMTDQNAFFYGKTGSTNRLSQEY